MCVTHKTKTRGLRVTLLMKGRTVVFLKLDRKELGDNELLMIKYMVQLSGWPLSETDGDGV